MKYVKQRVKDIFENTCESGIQWDTSIENIDFYSLMCKAASNNVLFNLKNNNVCMFKCNYEDCNSVLMVFSVPLNLENETKHITERIMDIVQLLEDCFITIDYLTSKEVKEEKFVYITAIKKLKEEV